MFWLNLASQPLAEKKKTRNGVAVTGPVLQVSLQGEDWTPIRILRNLSGKFCSATHINQKIVKSVQSFLLHFGFCGSDLHCFLLY